MNRDVTRPILAEEAFALMADELRHAAEVLQMEIDVAAAVVAGLRAESARIWPNTGA